jgi:hypothetical protein
MRSAFCRAQNSSQVPCDATGAAPLLATSLQLCGLDVGRGLAGSCKPVTQVPSQAFAGGRGRLAASMSLHSAVRAFGCRWSRGLLVLRKAAQVSAAALWAATEEEAGEAQAAGCRPGAAHAMHWHALSLVPEQLVAGGVRQPDMFCA